MYFTIHYTSGLYTSGYDYRGEYEELADKISTWTGLPTAVKEETVYYPRKAWQTAVIAPVRSYAVLIQVDDLSQLQQLQRRVEHEIVVTFDEAGGGDIEIVDDYRE